MQSIKALLKRRLPAKAVDVFRLWQHPADTYAFFSGPLTFNHDDLATSHNCDFIHEPLFAQAYQLGERTGSWGGADIRWRAHVVCWAAAKARGLAGDFVECGVNKGGYARMVAHYVNMPALAKTFYLLDTFEGLAEQYLRADEKELGIKPGGYEPCYEQVKQTFRDFSNVVIIKGPVPDTLSQVKTQTVCFLSIDMNCVEPEIAAAEFFWDKLVSGAVMLLDDYGHREHRLQKAAFDSFAIRQGVPVLSLPTGQGLIIKP